MIYEESQHQDGGSLSSGSQHISNTSSVKLLSNNSDVLQEKKPQVTGQESCETKSDKGIPWHHIQLYRLYGDEANYFLYPKLVVEKHSSTKPLSQRGFNASKHDPIGAKTLWMKLRSDSSRKLQDVDAKFAPELKSTYQSFVREFVSNVDNRDKRCMYNNDDVPEIDKLMDYSTQKKVKQRQHKTHVMWRASRKNEDNAAVLLYNNPLPDLNNLNGEDSIRRYLPPSLDLPGDSSHAQQQLTGNHIAASNISTVKPTALNSEPCGQFKCVFLTEADAGGSSKSLICKELSTERDHSSTLPKTSALRTAKLTSKTKDWVIMPREPVTDEGIDTIHRSSVGSPSEPLKLAALLDYQVPRPTLSMH